MDRDGIHPEMDKNTEDRQAFAAWQGQWNGPVRTGPGSGPVMTIGPGLTAEERNWAAVAHASAILTLLVGASTAGAGFLFMPLVPLAIYLSYRDRSDYVSRQALQALALQLVPFALLLITVVVLVPLWLVTALLMIVLVGLALLPVSLLVTVVLALAVGLAPFGVAVYGAYAALATLNGQPFRYIGLGAWVEQRWGRKHLSRRIG